MGKLAERGTGVEGVRLPLTPLPLVRESSGVYEVCDEGRRFLEGLDPSLNLGVVVVAGRYRTGKSFLLNRGVLEVAAKKGFSTGDSQKACTRGVWIYPTPLSANDGRSFVALDTEGTASLEARADQDAQLIGIALSLASVFIFNSTGSLDETSLSDLATLTSVARLISEAQWQAPELLWVLRDFALKLQGDDGQELGLQAYLERALSEELYGKGGVRATLKHFFRKRTLLTMVRPCTDEAKLQSLNDLGVSALRPEFQRQLEQFRLLVKAAAAHPKQLGDMALNGAALAQLALAAVASVNEGKTPSVQTTFDFMQERRVRVFEEEAVAALGQQCCALRAQLPLRRLPRLAPPARPAFMEQLVESWGACEARLLDLCGRLQRELEAGNDVAGMALAETVLAEVEAGAIEGRLENVFEAELQHLESRLGSARTLPLVPRLHAAHAAVWRHELAAAAEALAMQAAPLLPLVSPEDVERRAAELRQEAQLELHAFSEARDSLAQELRAAQQQLETAHASEATARERLGAEAAALQRQLEAVKGERDAAQEAGHSQTTASEAAQAAGAEVELLRAEFQAIVQSCESRGRQARLQCRAAEERSRAAEEQLEAGRQRVAEELGRLREQQATAKRDYEELRRRATQELLEKRQLMAEAYSGVALEAQRSHESALAADRRLMVVEVERESLKRRVDALEVDALELAKTRRLFDDVRLRHASAESNAEASAKLQALQAAQLLRLEAELRDLRTASQQRDRELTRKAAVLELQLQAHGVGA